MAGRIMTAPKSVCILIPDTYEYVTLHGNGDFTDTVKLIILRWGDDFSLGGFSVNHKASLKEGGRKVKGRSRKWDEGSRGWSDVL